MIDLKRQSLYFISYYNSNSSKSQRNWSLVFANGKILSTWQKAILFIVGGAASENQIEAKHSYSEITHTVTEAKGSVVTLELKKDAPAIFMTGH